MRPLLEEPFTYLQRFFSDFRRPATTLLLLGVLLVSLQVLLAVLRTLENIIVVGPLLKLVGFGYTVWFVSQNLLYAHKRRRTWEQLSHLRREVVGEAKDWLESHAAPAQPTQTTAKPIGQEAADTAKQLAAAAPLTPSAPTPAPTDTKLFAGVVGTVQVLIPLTGLVDVDALKAKIEKDLTKVEAEIKSLSGRLSNPGFVNKAPEEVVQGAREALAEAETQASMLQSRLEML
jgi:valyl-tRNA synthetase